MLNPSKILIIDDEPSLLRIMTKFLEKLNFSSETAENGRKGIEIFQHNPSSFSYVFIDYNLPELSPKYIITEIRKMNPSIKVILSTGYSVDDIKKELKPVKIDGTLQKPFTFTDLKNLLNIT